MVPESEEGKRFGRADERSLLSNGRSPWLVRGRKGDSLEEKVAVNSSQKQRKEEVGETGKRVFSFQVQVLGSTKKSPAGRRIPAAQKRRPGEGDMQELSAIGWNLNPRLFQGAKARRRGAWYTVDRCMW